MCMINYQVQCATLMELYVKCLCITLTGMAITYPCFYVFKYTIDTHSNEKTLTHQINEDVLEYCNEAKVFLLNAK
jgi:hypothetical protein